MINNNNSDKDNNNNLQNIYKWLLLKFCFKVFLLKRDLFKIITQNEQIFAIKKYVSSWNFCVVNIKLGFMD